MSEPIIRVTGLSRRFGDVAAVDDVSLDIAEGAFFALLGPSGCGKTTLLRMIAGLEVPSTGTILIDGRDMAAVPANRRPVNMVFQSYAVFPHMNVADNVGFGLKVDGVGRAEREARVSEALALVRLEGFERRMPDQLSGGQRQRVALARALVKRPRVLLLDEPLSALDAQLRETMQAELAQIQRQVGITFVMVTHDQNEALALATRCALMAGGRLRQVGTPADLYDRPADRFAAEFIGRVNLFEGRVHSSGVACEALGPIASTAPAAPDGALVWIALRPEKVDIGRSAREGAVAGTVRRLTYQGGTTLYEVVLTGGETMRVSRNGGGFGQGDEVWLSWAPEAVTVLTS